MRPRLSLAMAALVFLFFAEGQRAYFAALFALGYEAFYPTLDVSRAALALLPFLVLLAPLVPLTRWLDRRGGVALGAVGVAVFRLPMTLPDFAARAVMAALVVGSGALFLTWAVGYLDRRAVAAGAVAGLAADQLLVLAGTSYDLSLQPAWVPVQALASLALLAAVLVWGRGVEPDELTDDGLERRTGGLRLRSALALGVLLFLDLHILGLPQVVFRWTGLAYGPAAVATAAAAGVVLALVCAGRLAGRSRGLAMGAVLLVAVGVFGGWYVRGTLAGIVMAAGHAGALFLIARTLNPASGRRGRGIVTVGMLTFALLAVLYGTTFFYAYVAPVLRDRAPLIFACAVVLLAAALILLPQPPSSVPLLRLRWGAAAGAVPPALAFLLLALVVPPEPEPPAGRPSDPARVASEEFTVGTYNIHYGYDESWRFDPDAIARVIEAADPDVVALQEVPAGLPTAYGIDFALWLSRRLGVPIEFAPTINGLQGDAVLTGLPVRSVKRTWLPPESADRKQIVRLELSVENRPLGVYALHLDVDPGVRQEQMWAAQRWIAPGRAVVLGDLNVADTSAVVRMLAILDFSDAFADAAVPPEPTAPARTPVARSDRIWTRGLWVNDAYVAAPDPSDHRMVVATLQVPTRGVR